MSSFAKELVALAEKYNVVVVLPLALPTVKDSFTPGLKIDLYRVTFVDHISVIDCAKELDFSYKKVEG